jgi:DNA mismatch repair protein MutS
MASTDHNRWKPMTDTKTQATAVPAIAPPAGEFRSILFVAEDAGLSNAEEPAFFADLNLDQVVASIVAGRDEYDLEPFFHAPLRDVQAVEYRHEVFRDLETGDVRAAVDAFGGQMQQVRRYLTLARRQPYKQEKERWFLDAAKAYCDTVAALHAALVDLGLGSRGLRAFRDYLSAYTGSERFTSLASGVHSVLDGLNNLKYAVRIKGARVTVTRYHDEPDYSIELEETFARFRRGAVENHLVKIPDPGSMDHVEAQIVQLVARLYPSEFAALDEFCSGHQAFLDPPLSRFDREIQFYLAYLEHENRVKGAGVAFTYPVVSVRSKEISVDGGCDLALAANLASEGKAVVRNDFFLREPERVLVVTGPNQGGKTTFARMFGQLHYLAGLGVPVPAGRAQLFLPDRVFTHFERKEDIRTLRGKLDDELVRIRQILEQATDGSVVILNEAFASTTLDDSVYLGTEVLGRVIDLGCLAVWVTFVDELSSLSESTASMVATVEPDDPSQRTFKIVRQAADGRAYAWALADKYGLSYDRLRSRIGR